MSNTWLVIPSNRMSNLRRFFEAWGDRGGWDNVVVVEDAPQQTTMTSWMPDCLHFSYAEIAEVLGDDAWIISKRDSACRCFGFLVAWWGGADHVLTLDDDVRPMNTLTTNFARDHRVSMLHPRWVSNVFGLRTRGLPYAETDKLLNVVANVGLWTGHPDFDAVGQLLLIAERSLPCYALPNNNWIIPHGQFAPICGMNLCIERKALPLAFFPLMGEGQPFARFDDIWMGIVFKHCCDTLGWHISVGRPFVDHQKASDPFVNLKKEAPGIGANERFWQVIADIDLKHQCDPLDCLQQIGLILRNKVQELGQEHADYWLRLSRAMLRWTELFRKKPKGL